jgi:tetratricopeptide (TPR) repeat protein
MNAETATPHVSDPIFQEVLQSFQTGDWTQGFEQLDVLVERYPSKRELRDFRDEMRLRARIDQYEVDDKKRDTRKKILRWGVVLTFIGLLIASFVWGINSYSTWLQDQWSGVRANFVEEIQAIDTAVKFSDAQNYLSAGRPQDALSLLVEIEEQNPDFPGLDDIRAEATQTLALEEQYQEGVALQDDGDLSAALAIFEDIKDEHSNYKDVDLRIEELEQKLILDELLTQAETAYENEDWAEAILLFKNVRELAPKYEVELIEDRLIASYINAANFVLETEAQTSETLMLADSYFRDALKLRPMDAEILTAQDLALSTFKERLFNSYLEKARATLESDEDSLEALAIANTYYDLALEIHPDASDVKLERKMTASYLLAQQGFMDGDYDAVINHLEFIYENDPEYAEGTSRQTLYDAYMQRGGRLIASGEYEAAIGDFQRASEIADDSPKAKIHVYWALVEMGDVYGILGEYQKAVSLFNHAVEWIGLRDILGEENQQQVVLLDEADRYAGLEWYRTSYRLYKRVLPADELIYSSIFHDVQDGEYLTQLASQYDTTVEAILEANGITNLDSITIGQRILIPVLRGDGE